MSLGQRIRQLRQSRGLTQSQLGGAELSKSFISLLERGRTQPSVGTLRLLAARLGTSVDALLGTDGNLPEMVTGGLLAMSRQAIEQDNVTLAERLLEPVRFLATTYGLHEAQIESDLQLAELEIKRRDLEAAWSRLQNVRRAANQNRDFWRSGRVLLLCGVVKLRQRQFEEARRLLEQSLAVLRRARAGRDPARVQALIHLGSALGYMDDLTGALRRFAEAAKSEVAHSHPLLRGRALWGMGLVERKRGNLAASRDLLLRAKDAIEQAEDLPDLMRVYHNLGQLAFEGGQYREALRHLHRAFRGADRLHSNVDKAAMLTEIARVHLHTADMDEAVHFADLARVVAQKANDPVQVAEASVVLARALAARGEVPAAIELLKGSVATFRERKMHARMAEAAHALGLLLRERGSHAQAAEYLALSLEHLPQSQGETARR